MKCSILLFSEQWTILKKAFRNCSTSKIRFLNKEICPCLCVAFYKINLTFYIVFDICSIVASLGTFTFACTDLLVTRFCVVRQNLEDHNDLKK